MRSEGIENPILNSPYDLPAAHFELGPDGPTGKVLEGRRPSESFIPVPPARKGKEQGTLDFDPTGERREQNTLINDIRFEVERSRARGYPGATPITRKLVQHWSAKPPEREEPAFFCQREAAETAIFLAEVAGRHGCADYRTRIDPENATHNDGLPRVALKMATATGKTVVLGMFIAWQTANKVATPNDARFAKRFLIVTPEIVAPEENSTVAPSDVVARWEQVTEPAGIEIVAYQVIVEREDPLRVLDVKLPATATELRVPAEFMEPGVEYKVEVLAIEKRGNQTLTEVPFVTA